MSSNKLDLEILPDLKDCSCYVWRYRASHSRLMIKVVRGDVIEGEVFYLVLTSVRYFSGPMIWSGHAFRFGTQEEIARILGKLPGDLESSADKPEHDNPLLLVFEGASQILCHHVTAFDEFPGE